MDKELVYDRVAGSLLAGAAGDALGYAIEFSSWNEICRAYGATGITSYKFSRASGKALVSDDTQMTLYTAAGALAYASVQRDVFDLGALRAALYDAYLHWYRTQDSSARFASSQAYWLDAIEELHSLRAPGNTCLSALGSGTCGTTTSPINNSKGCGGVMRVAPLGCFGRGLTSDQVALSGAEAGAMTHGHSLGYIPGATSALLVHKCVFRETPRAFDELAHEAVDETLRLFASAPHIEEFAALMRRTFELASSGRDDRACIDELGGGWVGEEALAIALYCALRWRDDLDRCLVAAVNHSGDSDSTGAIAGNLLGAYLGRGRIAAKWLDRLELRDEIERIARELTDAATASDERKLILD